MTIIFGPPCRQCGKAVSPFVKGGDDMQGHICETCYADEQKAYGLLLGHLASQPAELAHCESCLKTLDTLERETGKRKLYMDYNDGVVALKCRKCADAATALKNSTTAQGRMKHLSREEFFLRMVKDKWRKLRKGIWQ